MASFPTDPTLSEEDYSAIEGAVMETARGRWFLAEYARRNRNADTTSVLDAIDRLERAMEPGRQSGGDAARLRFDLLDMAGAIARTKSEIAAIKPDGEQGRIGDATNELDAIVKSTEVATGDILAAAEHLQEVAWTLREAGVEGAACDIIDLRATDIYTACSFQDITGQRIQKVIHVLRYLEERLAAMIAIWGLDAHAAPAPAPPREQGLLNGPALPGQGLEQSDVDAMMAAPAAIAALPQPLPIESATDAQSEPESGVEVASPFTPVVRPKPRSRAPATVPARVEAVQVEPAQVEPAELAATDIPTAALLLEERPEPPAIVVTTAPQAPTRPTPIATRPLSTPTMADVDALSFEEKAALFS